jgi:hypothetical protein
MKYDCHSSLIDSLQELDVPRGPKTNDESQIDSREQSPDHHEGLVQAIATKV